MTTHQWNQYMADPTVAGLAHHPRMMPVGGGVPIVHEGRLVGGIGISGGRSEEHTSALQSLMRISYAVFCLKKQKDSSLHIDHVHKPIHNTSHIYTPLLHTKPIYIH